MALPRNLQAVEPSCPGTACPIFKEAQHSSLCLSLCLRLFLPPLVPPLPCLSGVCLCALCRSLPSLPLQHQSNFCVLPCSLFSIFATTTFNAVSAAAPASRRLFSVVAKSCLPSTPSLLWVASTRAWPTHQAAALTCQVLLPRPVLPCSCCWHVVHMHPG